MLIRMNKNSLKWVDVHTHLNMLKSSIEKAISAAQLAGVNDLITIGTEPEDWSKIIHLTKIYPSVSGALGLHPHSAKLYNDEVEKKLLEGLKNNSMLACGEIGLDYYYEFSEKKIQKEVFYRQMVLAEQNNLPVEVHSRSAEKDTLNILSKFKGRVTGLIHCFSGSWEMARTALDIGFDISFSGIVTFKNAEKLREVCKKIPLNRLHLETDAPYLAPVPHRGQPNQPAWLIHTAEAVASLRGVSLQKLSEQTLLNKKNLFENKNQL